MQVAVPDRATCRDGPRGEGRVGGAVAEGAHGAEATALDPPPEAWVVAPRVDGPSSTGRDATTPRAAWAVRGVVRGAP